MKAIPFSCFSYLAKTFTLQVLLLITLISQANAQCYQDFTTSSTAMAGCSDYFNEEMADYYAEGVIYLNFHFIRDNNGERNFTTNGDNNTNPNDGNYSGITIANEILDKLNILIKHESLLDPNKPGSNGDVPSPKMLPWRYELYTDPNNSSDVYDGIWFWNSSYYDQDLGQSYYNNINYSHIVNNYQPYGNKVLDVYFVEFNGTDDSMAGYAPESGTGGIDAQTNKGDGIFLYNTWKAYNNSKSFHHQAFVLNHEIGHVLGLNHTNQTSNCSDILTSNQDASSNNVMYSGLTEFNTAFAPCQVNIMYNLFQNSPIREYYIKTDPCNFNSTEVFTVEDNEDIIFNSMISFDRNIVIESGGKLTIECLLNMPTYGQIKVKPGGELIIDGGTLTSGCPDEMWFGVQVFGNKQNQNGNLQGILTSKANSVISNAIIGISNPDISLLNSLTPTDGGGGILDIDGTTFLNNNISVGLFPYKFTYNSGNSVLKYPASFDDCKFVTDDDYWDGTYEYPVQMQLLGVNGPTIKNSSFINERTAVDKLIFLGIGILSYGSGFTTSFSDPPEPPTLDRPLFKGYQYGVAAFGGFNDFVYSLSKNDFKENVVGVTSVGVDKFTIQNCNFEVGGLDMPYNVEGNDIHEGISVLTGSTFNIRNNDFYAADNTPIPPTLPGDFFDPVKYGLRVLNTGEAATTVRNNTFTDLYIANKAEGLNRSASQNAIGLNYLCNQNENFDYDFIVQKIFDADGILFNQGASNSPAKNTFTQLADLFGSDFINGSDWPIQYWWYDNVSYPEQEPIHYYSSKNFIKRDVETATLNCGTIGSSFIPFDIDSIERLFSNQDHLFDSLTTVRSSLLDGGSTSTWISILNATTSSTKADFLSHLSSLSPYTSESLLNAILEKTTLFNLSEITSILQQNAHFYIFPDLKAKAESLWSISENSMASIFTAYNNDLLRLDSKISFAASQRGMALSEILYFYASDTLQYVDIDYWLNQVDNIEYSYMLVDQAMSKEEFEDAEDILNDIESEYTPVDRMANVHTDYLSWNSLANELVEEYSDLNTWIGENETDLLELASHTISKPAANARGLLRLYDPEFDFYWPPLDVEDEIEPRSSERPTTIQSFIINTVYPNPALDKIWFEHKVNANDLVHAKICDVSGIVLLDFKLNAGSKHIIDVEQLSPGIYYISLIGNNNKTLFRFAKSY